MLSLGDQLCASVCLGVWVGVCECENVSTDDWQKLYVGQSVKVKSNSRQCYFYSLFSACCRISIRSTAALKCDDHCKKKIPHFILNCLL